MRRDVLLSFVFCAIAMCLSMSSATAQVYLNAYHPCSEEWPDDSIACTIGPGNTCPSGLCRVIPGENEGNPVCAEYAGVGEIYDPVYYWNTYHSTDYILKYKAALSLGVAYSISSSLCATKGPCDCSDSAQGLVCESGDTDVMVLYYKYEGAGEICLNGGIDP